MELKELDKKINVWVIVVLISIILLIQLIQASSYNISFVPPTPANDTTTLDTSIEINVSIVDGSDLKEVIYNWNGTNYSMYNDSLVLMMNFDNVSALGESDTHIFDASGNGNNGTPTNGAHVNTTDCKFGNCFTFDGDNDRVLIDDDASLNFGNFTDFTLESWIRTSSSGYQYIFWKGQQQNGRWYGIRVDSPTGRISAFIDDGVSNPGSNGVTSVGDGNWHYVVTTYDRDGDMTVYLDGVQEGNPTDISSINNITNTLELGIGAGRVFGGAWGDFEFDGEIDEARVYNRILSADEITQNYMLNLNKYDTDKWLLYVNQSKNTTAGLDNGTYTYQTFASDTSDNWNQTDLRFINIGPVVDTCTYTSGNWDVDCSDECNITSNVVGDGSNLTLSGSGNFRVDANISQFDYIIKDNSCQLIKSNLAQISII